MNEVIESIKLNTKKAYKESVIIDNEKLQDLLITILADVKKLESANQVVESTILETKTRKRTSTRYTYEQVKAITAVELKLAKELISLRAAEEEVLKISSTFPIYNLTQYTKKLKNILSGIGEYGLAFPANWAQAILEATNNNPLVIKAFRQQQDLYLKRDNRINQRLEVLLDKAEANNL